MEAKSTVYFGYGSNLWLQQMKLRCPQSEYLGVARLNNYRWIINERGYANVVETASPPETAPNTSIPVTNVSYGLVYTLSASDEAQLDKNEGVPTAYTKEYLCTDFWPAENSKTSIDITQPPEEMAMLVYISRNLAKPSAPKAEYIYRMNKGIADAVSLGIPISYINATMRPFIPEKHSTEVEEQAKKQALVFQDET